MSFLNKLNNLISKISCALLILMTVLVLLQVLFRFVFVMPLQQSEELATFSMIWLIMLASSVLLRNKTHIGVTFFVELFPDRLQKVIRIINHILILAVCLIITIFGFELTMETMTQIAPASRIPMGYIILSVPTFGLLGSLYTIENILGEFLNQKNSKIDLIKHEGVS